VAAPTLEELRQSRRPAWLWDAARHRVVWANEAGIAALGGETLFDLIDRPFDSTQPSIRKLSEISIALKRGETIKAELDGFCDNLQAVSCDCSIHALTDGRSGLLVIAEDPAQARSLAANVLAQAFDEQPSAAVVTSGEGLHANRAAREMFEPEQLVSLASLMGGAERAEHLWKRVAHSGVWREVLPIATKYGEREVKLTARRAAGEAADSQSLVVVIEDVSDRRALERQLVGKPVPAPKSETQAKAHKPEKSEKAKASRLSRADETAFNALGLALKTAGTPPPQQPPKDNFVPVDLPQPILRRLDSLQEPTLIIQGGQIHYANAHAIELLGAADGEAVLTSSELGRCFDRIGEKPAGVAVPTADGGRLLLTAAAVQIAWRGGPARQITLARPEAQTLPEAPQAAFTPPPAPLPVAPIVEPPRVPEAKQSKPVPAPAPREPDEELRTILDTAADGIITLAADGTIRSFSAAAEAIFGYRSAEVSGRAFAELFAPESRKTLRDYLAALQGPGLASVFNDGREVTAIVKQGGEVPLFLTIGRLQPKRPESAAFCAVVRDITQWKKTEQELRDAKETAEQASRQKSEFLAKISHELRTPLNAILGFSDVMRLERFGEIRNDKYRGYVNDIHTSGAHLLSLINDLLDLSKVEAGKLELNFTAVDLAEVVDHAFKLVQEQATVGRVILRKNIPPELPNVVADLRSMRQIMINLLSNAVKFTDPGGQVIVSAQFQKSGELKLRVKDTGIGMSESDLRDALEPFQRVATEGRDVVGTGLGLPLTKALAEANRATFAISSEPRKGTLVEITFPTTRVLAA
jgi:PAS domain S-box-containing protein